jgi:hypothetical protein
MGFGPGLSLQARLFQTVRHRCGGASRVAAPQRPSRVFNCRGFSLQSLVQKFRYLNALPQIALRTTERCYESRKPTSSVITTDFISFSVYLFISELKNKCKIVTKKFGKGVLETLLLHPLNRTGAA